jgi:hypothetical protein
VKNETFLPEKVEIDMQDVTESDDDQSQETENSQISSAGSSKNARETLRKID